MDSQSNRLLLVARCTLLSLVTLASIAKEASPGAQERNLLIEASRGDLQGVFLVKLFSGYVAFPRTSVLADLSGRGATRIDVTVEGLAPGTAYVGWYVRASDGKRTDVEHSRTLPSGPTHVEQRGGLTIEYFDAPPNVSTILICNLKYRSGQYVLLLGSAATLANEIVRASVALTGPPSVTSGRWQAPPSWVDLPVIRGLPEMRATGGSEDERECVKRVDETGAERWDHGSHWSIFDPFGPADRDSTLVKLGMLPQDKIVGINGQPIRRPEDWLQALDAAHKGQVVSLTIARGATQVTATLEKATVDYLFQECWSENGHH